MPHYLTHFCRARSLFIVPFCILVLICSHVVVAQGWHQLATTNNPPPRKNASAVYDPIAHRIVLFGGSGTSGNLNDLWEFNLATLAWQQIVPVNAELPPVRFTHNAVFDSAQNRMIVWSGQGSGLYNDVWAFNFSTNNWQQLWANGNAAGAPLIRYGTAAAFDPLHRRLINFAGFTSSGRFKDTWHLNVDAPEWTDKSDSNNPLERCLHTACFVPDRRKMIVYGGQRSGTLDDIWALNTDTFVWANLTPPVRPAGRWFSSIVYDGKGNILMFGGQTANGASNEFWRFSLDMNMWELIPSAKSPEARYGHSAVYVPSRNSMLVIGGLGLELYSETWEVSSSTTTSVLQTTPAKFQLSQNYPNPFNPTTIFEFQIANSGLVVLKVYDLLGNEVATIVNERLIPGTYRRTWDARAFPNGVYYYRLQSAGTVKTKKLILLK